MSDPILPTPPPPPSKSEMIEQVMRRHLSHITFDQKNKWPVYRAFKESLNELDLSAEQFLNAIRRFCVLAEL